MNRRKKVDIIEANVGDFFLCKPLNEIIRFCEAKGYEAERQKDYRMREFYWQHAEHYKRT